MSAEGSAQGGHAALLVVEADEQKRWMTYFGLPALIAEVEAKGERWAPRYVLRCDLAAEGRAGRGWLESGPGSVGA